MTRCGIENNESFHIGNEMIEWLSNLSKLSINHYNCIMINQKLQSEMSYYTIRLRKKSSFYDCSSSTASPTRTHLLLHSLRYYSITSFVHFSISSTISSTFVILITNVYIPYPASLHRYILENKLEIPSFQIEWPKF